MSRATTSIPTQDPEPAWGVATLFPPQGQWTEEEYLDVTDSTNRPVELVNGRLEVLPMPTMSHQLIVMFLYRSLYGWVSVGDLGCVLVAALRVHVERDTFREPDVVYMARKNFARAQDRFWEGADLAMEVVSADEKSHKRDWADKRRDYARAGIREYWIVDPQERRIVVLKLDGRRYVKHSEAGAKGEARSALLAGFTVQAAEVWAATKP